MTSASLVPQQVEATLIGGCHPALFVWAPPGGPVAGAAAGGALSLPPGEPSRELLSVPAAWVRGAGSEGLAIGTVKGRRVPMEQCVAPLAMLPLEDGGATAVSRSVSVWSQAAKLAVELVAGQRAVPWIDQDDGVARARWRAVLSPRDHARAEALARALPPAARAWPGAAPPGSEPRLMSADAAVRLFLDAAVDALVRPHVVVRAASSWSARLAVGLAPGDGAVPTRATVEEGLPGLLRRWVGPGLGDAVETPVRLGLRLDLPRAEGSGSWPLTLVAEAAGDPSLRVEARELWEGTAPAARALLALAPDAQEAFLLELGRACRLWPPLEPCLDDPAPSEIGLAAEQVVELVGEAASLLGAAGFSLHVPPQLSVAGRQRLRARLRGRSRAGESGEATGRFGLAQVMSVQWEAALGDEPISLDELRALADAKRPLVQWRDQWLVVDPAELSSMLALLEKPPGTLEGAAALRAVLAGEADGPGGLGGELVVDDHDALVEVLGELRAGASRRVEDVPGLRGTLRPYQEVGTAWLDQLGRLGLGACLADDMGLGKTVQVIASLLLRRAGGVGGKPSLVVCPTSVVGNWERELRSFAPGIPVWLHHGPDRKRAAGEIAEAAGEDGVVLTTYGVLRSDAAKLASLSWDTVILDEAQFIKNHRSKVAAAARALTAQRRIALTGTPVENRLTDLWSIFAFINPGLLGGVTRFKKEIATPVERFRNPDALDRFQRLTSPFILRRTKDDPAIAPDLPPRIVLRSTCTLSREQASLYQATLDAAMEEIEASEKMDRRGKVLALITALKQICNHPAQFLREHDAAAARSGKLRRLARELETILAEGDAVLLFTQYRTMGDILVRFLEERLAVTAPFLHGGVRRAEREAMVARFQRQDGPPVMVISVKAGGTGINLTRANHVFHVDRWWNPAVEAQATDRTHRIGQKRTVFVHALVTAGTLEERIDRMLEEKAELARLAVSGGERWLTELDDDGLREVLALDAGAATADDDEEDAP